MQDTWIVISNCDFYYQQIPRILKNIIPMEKNPLYLWLAGEWILNKNTYYT